MNEPVRAWWADAVVWDNHACMPLRADDAFLPQLERCRQSGLTVPDHVGLALDYVFDMQELQDSFAAHPESFPPEAGYSENFQFVPPEQIPPHIDLQFERGYPREAILKVIGGNHLRVAAQAWN